MAQWVRPARRSLSSCRRGRVTPPCRGGRRAFLPAPGLKKRGEKKPSAPLGLLHEARPMYICRARLDISGREMELNFGVFFIKNCSSLRLKLTSVVQFGLDEI